MTESSPRLVVTPSGRQAVALAALVALDLAVSLPIMGATYGPAGWKRPAPASETLYPVIQELTFGENGKPVVGVAVTPVSRVVLQRRHELRTPSGWTDVAASTALSAVVWLTDTNPVPLSGAVFYRVEQTPL